MCRTALAMVVFVASLGLCLAAEMPEKPEHVNSLGMRLVRIAPGTFQMGSAQGGDFDERPAHRASISRAFYLGATEVTNAQYEKFDPEHRRLRGKLGFSRQDDEAVVFVSWHDADRFCRRLSQQEGLPYRLPTEAEWEYACRAGSTTAYQPGDTLPQAYQKNVVQSWFPGSPQSGEGPVELVVGRTPPNPWGLFDMHGNVEEWCLDWYGPYQATGQTDPVGWADGDFRVTRGGSHSTTPEYLRSANRLGTLPDDKSWLIGFRVCLGPLPAAAPLPAAQAPLSTGRKTASVGWTSRSVPTDGFLGTDLEVRPTANPVAVLPPPLNARDVRQAIPPDLEQGPDPQKPYFKGPRQYVKIPPGSEGPLFSQHNHCPAIVECPNGDLLAIWYTCRSEPGRELGIAASRLRFGQEEWEEASPFWDAPDRNDHGSAFWSDGKGAIYHFNGLSAAATWGSLAAIMRVSRDSGATWSKARLIMPEHGLRHQIAETVIGTADGAIFVPADAVTGGHGGTAVLTSRDGGQTWIDPGEGRPQPEFRAGATGAWIAGIHAGIVELKDGRLMAFGRGDSIDGRMPMSVSSDGGRTWTYSASPFRPIGSGQRLAVLRLREGPIFFASFAKQIAITGASGRERQVSGLFAALSTDEGQSWSVRRLITDDQPVRQVDGGGNTGRFTLGPESAEPGGYLSVCQAANGLVHLITSKQHYVFNLRWLETPAPARGP